MKKIKTFLKTSFIVLSVLSWQIMPLAPALALGTPFAVAGQVTLDGAAADGAAVVLTDTNTGATLSDTVGPTGAAATSGWYSFDLGNLSVAATNGDTINIVATINGLSGSTSFVYNSAAGSATPPTIAIVTPVLTSITVNPASASIATGATQQFTATALDQNGAALNPQPAFTWSSANPAVATIDATGLATGVSAGGPIVISAASGAITGTSNLTVTATPVLTTLNISPASASVIIGATQQFTATALDQFGAPFVGAILSWSSSNTAAATVDAAGLVTGAGVGTSTITVTATSGATSLSATAAVSVSALPVLTSITVSPASASIATGATQQFTATALDQNGAALNPQPAFTWSSASTSIATVDAAGLATAAGVGATTITVSSGAISATANLTVAAPVLTTISITPNSASIILGATQQFAATALDQFGAALSPQPVITWSSANSAVATVNAAGLATGAGLGTTTIIALSGVVSGTATLAVTPVPALTTLTISPLTASVVIGTTTQFTATALDQFGAPINAVIAWSTGSSSLATVSAVGLVTGVALGTTTVTASSGALSATANLTVTPVPVLTSISVAPATATIAIGATRQFTATALDQFGAALNPQPAFTWSSSSTTKATISASGLATGLAAGSGILITATSGAISGVATVNVLAATLTSIYISPVRGLVKVGDTLQMRAVGLDQTGSPLVSQPTFVWSSGSPTVASISASGLATGLTVGTTTISAANGSVVGVATLTVSTSSRVDINDDLTECEHTGALVPEMDDDYATTTALTATHDIYFKIHSAEGESEIDLPSGVRISREDGSRFDGTGLTGTSTPASSLSGLAAATINGALQWGLVSRTLVFSQPITLRIFVGAALNGQTLNVQRSISGSGSWTSDGIVAPATCLVANGLCTFQATKASYYAASTPAASTAAVVAASPGGGGGGPLPSSNAYADWLAQETANSSGGQVLGEQTIAEGALIRANGNIDVYIVKYVGAKKFKRLILNPSVFNSYQHLNWNDILNVDQSVVDSFTNSNLVRAAGDIRVYRLSPSGDTGTKQWITTAETFRDMGLDWDAVYEVNITDLNSYTTGMNL